MREREQAQITQLGKDRFMPMILLWDVTRLLVILCGAGNMNNPPKVEFYRSFLTMELSTLCSHVSESVSAEPLAPRCLLFNASILRKISGFYFGNIFGYLIDQNGKKSDNLIKL